MPTGGGLWWGTAKRGTGTVTCGAGTWQVRAPWVNDKRVDADGAHEGFTSRILPR